MCVSARCAHQGVRPTRAPMRVAPCGGAGWERSVLSCELQSSDFIGRSWVPGLKVSRRSRDVVGLPFQSSVLELREEKAPTGIVKGKGKRR